LSIVYLRIELLLKLTANAKPERDLPLKSTAWE
jgi:hypothetical protein